MAGNLHYSKQLCQSLWAILCRASSAANEYKSQMIESGEKITLPIRGSSKGNSNITFIIYHVPIKNPEKNIIKSFDVQPINFNLFDHSALVRMCINSILRSNENAEVILLTDKDFGEKFKDFPITLMTPDVDKNRPMYYRVKTYNTLIQKNMVRGTAVFLDSDLLILKSISGLPNKLGFSVAVTSRYAPNLMPINEGLIIADTNKVSTKKFFAHYMGAYEWIRNDKAIQKVTGIDLKVWRGGQLSLNSICPGIKSSNYLDSNQDISILPCQKYNYSTNSLESLKSAIESNHIFALHLKGPNFKKPDMIKIVESSISQTRANVEKFRQR